MDRPIQDVIHWSGLGIDHMLIVLNGRRSRQQCRESKLIHYVSDPPVENNSWYDLVVRRLLPALNAHGLMTRFSRLAKNQDGVPENDHRAGSTTVRRFGLMGSSLIALSTDVWTTKMHR